MPGEITKKSKPINTRSWAKTHGSTQASKGRTPFSAWLGATYIVFISETMKIHGLLFISEWG